MKIQYVTGDLLSAPEKTIVHGCNAQGVAKSGVAKVIREKYPRFYDDYKRHEKLLGLSMGDIIITEENPHIIVSAITQEYFGREPNTKYVSYDAIDTAFQKLDSIVAQIDDDIQHIAMPLIGAGLAQGSWSVIEKIIENRAINFKPVVYLLDGVIPYDK